MDIESLDVARVELQSRRIDKQGKVKQKLSVVGVRCGDCSVCLGRFRVDQYAVVLPKCLHVYVGYFFSSLIWTSVDKYDAFFQIPRRLYSFLAFEKSTMSVV